MHIRCLLNHINRWIIFIYFFLWTYFSGACFPTSSFVLVFIRYPEQLGRLTLWCVSAQVSVIPASPWFPSKPLVMAALAPAVAACAHHRLLAQWLSCPIYLTQTSASPPSPAYLSLAWFVLGVRFSLVSLYPGSQNEMGEEALAFNNYGFVCLRVHVFVKQFVRHCLRRKHGHRE